MKTKWSSVQKSVLWEKTMFDAENILLWATGPLHEQDEPMMEYFSGGDVADGLVSDNDEVRTAFSIWRTREDAVAQASRANLAVWILAQYAMGPTWFQVEPMEPSRMLSEFTSRLNDSHVSTADIWEVLAGHPLDDLLLHDLMNLRENHGLGTCLIFDFGDEIGGVERHPNRETWGHFLMPTEVFFADELRTGAILRLNYAAELAEHLHNVHGSEFLKRSVGRLTGEHEATSTKEILAKWAEPEMDLSNIEIVFVLNDVAFISDSSASHGIYFTHSLD